MFLNINCSIEKKNNLESQKRILYHYEMDSLVYQRNYSLVIKERIDYTIYEYVYSSDSTKNMIFRFDKKKDEIQSGPLKFENELLKNLFIEELSKKSFKSYADKTGSSHPNNSEWFNREYGILNFGYQVNEFYFLPEIENEKITTEIIAKLRK